MDQEFIVLYTSQKQKKAKVWHDGFLKHDGKGTKAMLYDEKGSRLDSIHIKLQDITLGEQLESDRYYILVESVKDTTTTQNTDSSVPLSSTKDAVEVHRPLSQRGGFSKARCSGLKRKKTGFMPPRMVKQPRQDDTDSPERSPLGFNNRTYPSQLSQSPDLGQTVHGSNHGQQIASDSIGNQSFHSNRENVVDIYSKSQGGKELYGSQGSNDSSPFSPTQSPWSVYGGRRKQSPAENVKTEEKLIRGCYIDKFDRAQESQHSPTYKQKDEFDNSLKNQPVHHGNGNMRECTEIKEYTDIRMESESSNAGLGMYKESPKNTSTNRNMKAIMDLLRKNKQNTVKEKSINQNSCDNKNITCTSVPDIKDKANVFRDRCKQTPDGSLSSLESCDFTQQWKGPVNNEMNLPDNVEGKGNWCPKIETDPTLTVSVDLGTQEFEHKDEQKQATTSKQDFNTPTDNTKPTEGIMNKTPEIMETVHRTSSLPSFDPAVKREASAEGEMEEESEGCFEISYSPLSHVTESDSDIDDEDIVNMPTTSDKQIQDEIDQTGNHIDVLSAKNELSKTPNDGENIDSKHPLICNIDQTKENRNEKRTEYKTDNSDIIISSDPQEKYFIMTVVNENSSSDKTEVIAKTSNEVENIEISGYGSGKEDRASNATRTGLGEDTEVQPTVDDKSVHGGLNGECVRDKTRHISTQSQDTMEFSCDTMLDDSENFFLPTPDNLKASDTRDNIICDNDEGTARDYCVLNSINKVVDGDKVMKVVNNEAESIQSSNREVHAEQDTMHIQKSMVKFRNEDKRSDFRSSFVKSEPSKLYNSSPDSTCDMSDIQRSRFPSPLMRGSDFGTGYRDQSGPSVTQQAYPDTRLTPDTGTDSISSEDCVVPASRIHEEGEEEEDDDVYDNLYKPRPMYQQHRGQSEAVDQGQTHIQSRSSLYVYKQQLAENKQINLKVADKFIYLNNTDNYRIDEQDDNVLTMSESTDYFDSDIRKNVHGDNIVKLSMKREYNIQGNDGTCETDKDTDSGTMESSVVHTERSKWDQYVPEHTEEEIDLTRFRRKEPVNRDFSVVETHTEDTRFRRKEFVKKDSSGLEPHVGDTSSTDILDTMDMCKDKGTSDVIASIKQKTNISPNAVTTGQHVQNTTFQSCQEQEKNKCDFLVHTVSETAESMSSMDSQELLQAADNIEKHLADTYSRNREMKQVVRSTPHIEVGNNSPAINVPSLEWSGLRFNSNGDRTSNMTDHASNNNTSNTVQGNDGLGLNDSLDLSLSFEDETDLPWQDKMFGSSKQPVLRAGWKPPSIHSDVTTNSGRENVANKVKPNFRCLQLLAKAKLPPSEQSQSTNKYRHNSSTVDEGFNKCRNTVTETDQDSPSHLPLKDEFEASNYQDFDKKHSKNNRSPLTSVQSSFKSPLISQSNRADVTAQQTGKRFKTPRMAQNCPSVKQSDLNRFSSSISPTVNNYHDAGQKLSCTELCFPGCEMVEFTQAVTRQMVIPPVFSSVHQYKQTLSSAVIENLNTVLFDISKRYHQALSRIDTSGYTKSVVNTGSSSVSVLCKCGTAAKILSVRKEGPNKGRQFYGCSQNAQQRCKFFQWAEGKVSTFNSGAGNRRKISEPHILGMYMKDQHLHFYPECQLVRKVKENIGNYFKRPKWLRGNKEEETVHKKQMFVKLPRKGHSSLYAKDDIWIISKDLNFKSSTMFIARSAFYGPLASNEVEIEPLYGYSPSNWSGEVICHGLLAGNASTELSCLENIREHLTSQSPQVLPSLLNRERPFVKVGTGFSVPRMVSPHTDSLLITKEIMEDLVRGYIDQYRLNVDQSEALRRVSHMFCEEKADSVDNILLLHGVFGAGKSFLLSVMVLFLVEVFSMIPNSTPVTWKLLISSTTNVAVDRILQGVLSLGFEDFVRVGSVKKIAKPILPYSIHASGTDSQELKDLQEMLRSNDLTPSEKSHVRQSIEKHRLGENKKKLGAVKVVGVTCASSSVASLNNMTFPIVFLDECSQMTEPGSLLPIARFGCQKLLLVGDPKQLDPTIEGAKAAHDQGLEQTMFDRLINMGYIPTILRTQYRCHPWISDISNQLFYGDILMNGVTEADRLPLLDVVPTICFYDVDRGQECSEGGRSVYNTQEAQFVVFLLQVLTSAVESSSIGVITLYRSQMSQINDLIVSCGDDSRLKGVQVSTVDAFQGGEKDIIILSCVRTHACGFIDNDKRTNVALTRAKHHLLIVGHYKNLSNNFLWGKVLQHCKGHKDGLQTADEARKNLETYMEAVSSQTESNKTDQDDPVILETRKSLTKGGKKGRSRMQRSRVTSPALTNSSIDSQSSVLSDVSSEENICHGTHTVRDSSIIEPDKGKSGHEKEDVQTFQTGEENPATASHGYMRKRSKFADRLTCDAFEQEVMQESEKEDLPVF